MKYSTNKSLIIKTLLIGTVLCLLFFLIPELAAARPGGGHSYSGGGGDGGGDGIAGLIIYLVMTLPPEISIPLVIIIIVLYYFSKRKKKQSQVVVASVPTRQNRSNEFQSIEGKIEQFKLSDANFSKTLFLDFVTSMFYKYYSNYSKKEFKDIRPFLAQHIYDGAAKVTPNSRTFSEIVIGNLKMIALFESTEYNAITVDIDANYTLTVGGRNTRFIVTERWLFNRKKGVASQGPERMRDLECPNCGAAGSHFTDAGKCEYCDTFIETGEMQWFVSQINMLRQEAFSTKGLGHYEQEVGTDYPTIVQPSIDGYINRFVGNHQLGDWNSYWASFTDNIASAYFKEIYRAWSDLQWNKVRHLLSDRLYDSYNFWIKAYQDQGLRNKLDNIVIQRIDMAAVDVDRYYESFTVRIFASCLDYVENKEGKVMGGSKKQPRQFSEYWTFIRRTGVEKKEEEFSMNNCPNCGAPADKMGQAAICEYCDSKISTGEFSWVLARIVQDEEYTG